MRFAEPQANSCGRRAEAESPAVSGGLPQRAIHDFQAVFGPFANLALELLLAGTKLKDFVGQVKRGEHCRAERIHRAGHFCHGAHALVHVARQLLRVRLIGFSAQVIDLVVDFDANRVFHDLPLRRRGAAGPLVSL